MSLSFHKGSTFRTIYAKPNRHYVTVEYIHSQIIKICNQNWSSQASLDCPMLYRVGHRSCVYKERSSAYSVPEIAYTFSILSPGVGPGSTGILGGHRENECRVHCYL